MTLNISVPGTTEELRPKITVIGVGGGGGNAINNMIEAKLEGVDFLVVNTDGQALAASLATRKIQLDRQQTKGLGAGSKPEVGRLAAEATLDEIMAELTDSHMVFITAGMGGGTGTGAAPVIAKAAREHGILTVGVVTKPFEFEGLHRMTLANDGIEELQAYVDTLIVIPNQNLFRLTNERTTFTDAFAIADEVLHQGVCGVTDLMIKPGMVNLDFADIRSVMSEMGKAMMGTGEASGDGRATNAAESAIHNPLLDETTLKGAQALLINITGGSDMTLFEVDEAANHIRKEIDQDAMIIFGAIIDEKMEGMMRISVVATGMESEVGGIRPPFRSEPLVTKTPKPVHIEQVSDDIVVSPTMHHAPEMDSDSVAPTIEVETPTAETFTAETPTVETPVEVSTERPSGEEPSTEPIAKTDADPDDDHYFSTHPDQMNMMDDIVNEAEEQSESAEVPTDDTVNDAMQLNNDDGFTLRKTADIDEPVVEQSNKSAPSLVGHISRIFSGKAAKPETLPKTHERKAPVIKPFAHPPEAAETEETAADTAPSVETGQTEPVLNEAREQDSPKLDIPEQHDEFDLEIPAFLRRQAN